MEKTTSSVLLHLKFNIRGAFLTNHWLLSSSFPSPSTDFKSLIKWSLAQKMISLVASQPGQWSNVVSHYTVVLVIGLRTSSSHKYAGFFPYCWRCITWTSGFPSQTVCLLSCPPIFKPMYFHIYFFFPQGVRAQCWEATALFRLVEEIPLEFSTASGMHAVCTVYTSNSSSLTILSTPQQRQIWLCTN